MKHNWKDLELIAKLKLDKELEKIASLRARQQKHMMKKASLSRLAQASRDELRTMGPVHMTSGDVHWQTWLGRTTRQLNMEEAQLRAMSEMQMPAVRKAFGQRQVIGKLSDQSKSREPKSRG